MITLLLLGNMLSVVDVRTGRRRSGIAVTDQKGITAHHYLVPHALNPLASSYTWVTTWFVRKNAILVRPKNLQQCRLG